MYVKVIVSVSILMLMLIGAWLLNEYTKREYYYTDNDPEEGIIQIQTTEGSNQGTFTNFPAFGSREYIRIVR